MGTRRRQAGGDIDSAASGHLDIEEDHIGTKLRRGFHRLRAGGGLAGHFDIRVRLQQLPQADTSGRFVVDDQNADHRYLPPAATQDTDCGRIKRTRVPSGALSQERRAASP